MGLFDLLIMAFFFAIVLLSFLAGFGKVASILAGMYLGAVGAAKLYVVFAEKLLVRLIPDMKSFTGELVSFLLILLIISLTVSIALARNHAIKRFTLRIGVINNLAGGMLGLVLAFLSTVLAGMAMIVFLQVITATGELGNSPTMSDMGMLVSDSVLVPMFAKMLPYALSPLWPWFPQGMPSLLASGS